MTEGLRLRPVTETDLDTLDGMFSDPAWIGEFNWQGFTDPGVWRRRFTENHLLTDERSVLVVEFESAMIGFVSFYRIQTGATVYVHQFGISLLPAARGRGHGTAAQLLLARYLFAHSPVNRIQAMTEGENLAEQRSLEKAGFVREAVLRGHTFRAGAWRDEVLYRMLRSELPA
jgi:RimJ/RimL family protein N-acetyltransferase